MTAKKTTKKPAAKPQAPPPNEPVVAEEPEELEEPAVPTQRIDLRGELERNDLARQVAEQASRIAKLRTENTLFRQFLEQRGIDPEQLFSVEVPVGPASPIPDAD